MLEPGVVARVLGDLVDEQLVADVDVRAVPLVGREGDRLARE
jgi:hypothetical protein